jgi:aspartate racemase
VETIGVLGGLGPQATMDFEARVHRVAQRLIAPSGNRGYPPLVVYYCRFVPHAAPEPGSPLRAHPDLLSAAAELGRLADFIVVTSNFVHLFHSELEQAAGCELLSMVDLALNEVAERAWRKVGVLGYGDPLVYTHRLPAMNVRSETVDGPLRVRLDAAIDGVMEGRAGLDAHDVAREALDALRAREVDGIVLGCTEIALLLGDTDKSAPDLLDPLELLAEAAVERASRTDSTM